MAATEATRSRSARIFSALDRNGDGTLSVGELRQVLARAGLRADDPRMAGVMAKLAALEGGGRGQLDLDTFQGVAEPAVLLLEQVAEGRLAVPDFAEMRAEFDEIFAAVRANVEGSVATYIPQLGRVNPELFGLALCTIDGQRHELGDSRLDFCLQSVCKPINYCLALEQHGEEHVHRHVGREPSGQGFNEITLDKGRRPHNPMINAGAIMCCSLIDKENSVADRFDGVMQTWARLCGSKVGFSNSVYLSERKTADRNFALGYFMQEHRCFPEGTDLIDTLEFYFQCCSIEANCDQLALAAATLAHGGVSPLTGERIFSPETVRACLSLMLSCGMYDFSGEFAFVMGLPAKSGVSGAIMVVIPNVMGFAVWSPRLDALGNSVRGLELCRRVTSLYNFHVYDSLTGGSGKRDPRRAQSEVAASVSTEPIWAAALGDLGALQRLRARGMSMDVSDYDGRTPLHLAAAEGHREVVEWLLRCGASTGAVDRGGLRPADAARASGHEELAKLIG